MELIVLGSGTTVPFGDRGCAAYALRAADGSVLLVDAGPGSTRKYPRVGIDPATIVGSLVTHHHADHVGDLPILLFLRNVLEPPLTTRLALVGPVGHADFLAALVRAYAPGLADLDDTWRITELTDGHSVHVGPFRVTAREVQHLPHALGYRVEADGASMAFSGDSGPCEALDALVTGVDVALLECSYAPTRESTGHLTSRTAAETAIRADVRRLVLTHFYPEVLATDIGADVRRFGYDRELVLAHDELTVAIGGPS